MISKFASGFVAPNPEAICMQGRKQPHFKHPHIQRTQSTKRNMDIGQMSIDEEELMQLLNEEEDRGVSLAAAVDPGESEVTGLTAPVDSVEFEEELRAALSFENDEAMEEEQSDFCPATPKDVKDVLRVKTESSGKQSTDGSSVEEDLDQKKLKRRVEQGAKSPMKKTKYYETDNTERKPGWAELMLKKQQAVKIPQNPLPTTPQEVEKRMPERREQNRTAQRQGGNARAQGIVQLPRPRDNTPLPPGWLDCPGLEGKLGFFLFSKTPLGDRWNDRVPAEKRLTPQMILRIAAERHQQIGLVIDLTNSYAYYDPREFQGRGVQYCKIRCCGFGSAPSPQAVNEFWWAVTCFERQKTNKFILVHCTHGFNRTGFMVAHYTMRWAERDTMNGILRKFAVRRPPGIYKDDYITELLDHYHELRTPELITPATPTWKGLSGEEKDDSAHNGTDVSRVHVRMVSEERVTADDVTGDPIHRDEELFLRSEILKLMVGPNNRFNRFPGAQPVSMDRSNLELLRHKRYWVTYKADGTRYMLLLMRHGAYLISRDFELQRIELRFPIEFKNDKFTVNPAVPHHMTLLDGEMVIDFNKEKNQYIRKYLVYDLVLHQGQSWMGFPWKQRFAQLQEIVNMRNYEKAKIEKQEWPFEYSYADEPFGVEAKMFWCMGQVEGIVKTIPRLLHECDGFIFQAYEDKYQIGTHEELLKWKYPHMNSVDFRFRQTKNGGEVYLLRRNEILCQDVPVVFDNEEDKDLYDGKIIECAYDKDNDRWTFLRERVDKSLPNAYTVYEKVLKSIRDNITQEELIDRMLELFSVSDLYERDRQKLAALDPVKT